MADTRVNNPNKDTRRDTPKVDRASDRSGRILTPHRVPEKSEFQRILEEANLGNQFSNGSQPDPRTTQTATKEAVKWGGSQQERYGRQKESFEKRFAEKERDREKSGAERGGRSSSEPRAKEAEKRVIARDGASEKKGGGKGGGQGQGHGSGEGMGQGKKGKGFAFTTLAGKSTGTAKGPQGRKSVFHLEGLVPSASILPGQTLEKSVKAARSHDLLSNKALIDQLVQYCRLVTKTDGDKEMDLQLHEEVFAGLRLRVALVRGEVEVTFLAESEEVVGLFESQKSSLREAISQKGIAVREIRILLKKST